MSDRMYTAEVIADSVSPEGHRITTVKAVYPHAVHKDMLRHRAHNRNVESFRAQPPEVLIENLANGHAFMPEAFASRVKGMGQGNSLDAEQQRLAENAWESHVDHCLGIAEYMLSLDIAKQQVNFLLQDLCPLTEIITATDWSNFAALRTEVNDDGTPVARPEVYRTAHAIMEAIDCSTPVLTRRGQIHLPFITEEEFAYLCDALDTCDSAFMKDAEEYWIAVSAGRCARISYGDFRWWEEMPNTSRERATKLLAKGHMSPFEQQAVTFSKERWAEVRWLQDEIDLSALPQTEVNEIRRQLEYSGNLHGWVPARKTFVNEHDYSLLKTR
jgi:hypothetical protein